MPQQPHRWAVVVPAASAMGALFGLAFYKSHVYEPQIIRGQFLFRRFVMLKVQCRARKMCLRRLNSITPDASSIKRYLLTSLLVHHNARSSSVQGRRRLIFSALSSLHVPAMANVRELWKPTSLTRGWITGPVLGGVLLGAGMATSGACPGMVWTALGAGTSNSEWTIVGGLLGALVYGVFADGIQRNVLNRGPLGPCSKVYADEALGKSSPASLTLALGIVCLCGCAALEALVPWKSEVPERFADTIEGSTCTFGTAEFSFWECPAWPPSVAGMLLGALQLPGVLLIGNVLGSATAFQICSSLWLLPLPSDLRSKLSTGYMNAFATPNPLAWWQLPYVALATLLANICAKTVDDVGGASGVDAVAAFVGGFILIFGSRLGGGCTSGHGLSGCALLMVQSWLAVPAMFAGGIALAVVWQSASKGEFFV